MGHRPSGESQSRHLLFAGLLAEAGARGAMQHFKRGPLRVQQTGIIAAVQVWAKHHFEVAGMGKCESDVRLAAPEEVVDPIRG